MNIIQIFDQTSPFVSGYSMRSRYITDSLAKLGVKIKVISSPIFTYKNDADEYNGISYIHSKMLGWNAIKKLPLIKEMMIVNNIEKTIQQNLNGNIKVIDAHSSLLNGIAASKICKKHKLPLIYEIRAFWEDAAVDQGKTKEGSLRYNLTRNMESKIINDSSKVTVICNGLKEDLIKRGIKSNKIEVIPNGVDTEKFKPVSADEELIKKYNLEGCKVFGFIGTFFNFEGLELLVKAAKQILIRNKDVKFLLVGGGREEENLKRMVRELGLTNHVIFTGRVKHEDISKYYSIIDILVYPRISKRITELVTPLKPLEAMSLEKIVIASDVGGLKELISEGYNGLLFESGDVNSLVEICLYSLNKFSQVEKMGPTARAFVIRERNWLKICQKYLSIFNELGAI